MMEQEQKELVNQKNLQEIIQDILLQGQKEIGPQSPMIIYLTALFNYKI